MRDKRAKFRELATKRVNRAIRELRLIGNLSNRSTYDYTEEEARKIVRTLQREMEALKARFSGPGDGGDSEFTL